MSRDELESQSAVLRIALGAALTIVITPFVIVGAIAYAYSAHTPRQGADQSTGESFPLGLAESLPRSSDFALKADPFQVDHVPACGRVQAVEQGDRVAEVGGDFHASSFSDTHLSTPHNKVVQR